MSAAKKKADDIDDVKKAMKKAAQEQYQKQLRAYASRIEEDANRNFSYRLRLFRYEAVREANWGAAFLGMIREIEQDREKFLRRFNLGERDKAADYLKEIEALAAQKPGMGTRKDFYDAAERLIGTATAKMNFDAKRPRTPRDLMPDLALKKLLLDVEDPELSKVHVKDLIGFMLKYIDTYGIAGGEKGDYGAAKKGLTKLLMKDAPDLDAVKTWAKLYLESFYIMKAKQQLTNEGTRQHGTALGDVRVKSPRKYGLDEPIPFGQIRSEVKNPLSPGLCISRSPYDQDQEMKEYKERIRKLFRLYNSGSAPENAKEIFLPLFIDPETSRGLYLVGSEHFETKLRGGLKCALQWVQIDPAVDDNIWHFPDDKVYELGMRWPTDKLDDAFAAYENYLRTPDERFDAFREVNGERPYEEDGFKEYYN